MDSKNGNVIHKKTVLNNIIKVLLSSDYPNHILIILVTRGTLFIYSTAAQIVTIHHIRYQHNHQQILTYKRVGYCLLTLFTFSTILNITMIKLNNLILFFFFFILSIWFYLTDLAMKQLKEKYLGQPTQILYKWCNGPAMSNPQSIKPVLLSSGQLAVSIIIDIIIITL